jgi:hypothetical protein
MLNPHETVSAIHRIGLSRCNTPFQQDTHRAVLFKRAATRHMQYAAWATDGQGVDRHLFGLKRMLAPGEEIPRDLQRQGVWPDEPLGAFPPLNLI